MCLRALAVDLALDELLGIVPGAPALDMKIARSTPVMVTPASKPPNISKPPVKPITGGVKAAMRPGSIIFRSAALVEISTQAR
jgi:hypothetical protein